MLEEIESSGIVVDPDGTAEALGNMCSISLSPEQAALLNTDDVVRFVYDAAARFDILLQSYSRQISMLFYCWIDQQAGQLRFSVVSNEPLPFEGPIQNANDAHVIASELLACKWLGGIPWDELHMVQSAELDDEHFVHVDSDTLNVFVTNLPLSQRIVE